MGSFFKSALMCVVGFGLFFVAWIGWLIVKFATSHEAVTLDIYRSELFHNPLFWLCAAIFAAVFAIAQVAAGEIHRRILRTRKRRSARPRSAGSFG
jgi:hypothetical protein